MYPELFHIGGFTMNSFGVMMALAFISAGFVAHWQFKKRGVKPDFIYGLLIAAVIGGLLGAKIHYLILHPSEWPGNLLSGGGLVWFGGLFGAIIAVVIVTLLSKQRLAAVMDAGRHRRLDRLRGRPDGLLPPGRRLRGAHQPALGHVLPQGPAAHHGAGCIPPSSTRSPASLVIFALLRLGHLAPLQARGPADLRLRDPGRHRALPGGVHPHQRAGGSGPHLSSSGSPSP